VSTQVTAEQARTRFATETDSPGLPAGTMRWRQARLKDVVDITLGSLMLVIVAPLMLLVALAIKLDSPGPILFVQQRVGVRRRRAGRWLVHEPTRFHVYKFRSMVAGADPGLHEAHIERYIAGAPLDGVVHARFKLADDPRITLVGRIIRRTSIDELPQLFNVLRRQMSLVGPRPVPVYEGRHYLDSCPERFWTLPGITGLWQVSGRCNLSASEMSRLDAEYVHNASFWVDAKIMLRTVPAVFSRRGAG
jgi:lipopolysaccharide/colanic/teichoic acid biosynthesis glycosyltransferase